VHDLVFCGEQLSYCTSQWETISRFLEYPDMPIDNNYAEQQIKNVVIGRKAWILCDSKVGATASANLYSLVMSARANDPEPFAYLSYLFEQRPTATTAAAVEVLLPWNVKKALRDAPTARLIDPRHSGSRRYVIINQTQ
jgi:hypothetical protein